MSLPYNCELDILTDAEIKEAIKHLKGVLAERQRRRARIKYLADYARTYGWTLRNLVDAEIPYASKAKSMKDAIRIAIDDEGLDPKWLLERLKKGPQP